MKIFKYIITIFIGIVLYIILNIKEKFNIGIPLWIYMNSYSIDNPFITYQELISAENENDVSEDSLSFPLGFKDIYYEHEIDPENTDTDTLTLTLNIPFLVNNENFYKPESRFYIIDDWGTVILNDDTIKYRISSVNINVYDNVINELPTDPPSIGGSVDDMMLRDDDDNDYDTDDDNECAAIQMFSELPAIIQTVELNMAIDGADLYKSLYTDFQSIINIYALITFCKQYIPEYRDIPQPILITNPHASKLINTRPYSPAPDYQGILVHKTDPLTGFVTLAYVDEYKEMYLERGGNEEYFELFKFPFKSDAHKWENPNSEFNITYDSSGWLLLGMHDDNTDKWISYGTSYDDANTDVYNKMINLMRQFKLTVINEEGNEEPILPIGLYTNDLENVPPNGINSEHLYNYFLDKIVESPVYRRYNRNTIPFYLYTISCVNYVPQ